MHDANLGDKTIWNCLLLALTFDQTLKGPSSVTKK